MELMGLAIIVILLSLAMLFVIKFVLLKEPSQQTEEYTKSELATNFLNTLLETNAPKCSNVKFDTLFMDCATNNAQGGNIPCDDGADTACNYIKEIVTTILKDTFDEWKIKYRFVATTSPVDNIFYTAREDTIFNEIIEPDQSDYQCSDTSERKGKIQPLPSNPQVNIALFICG